MCLKKFIEKYQSPWKLILLKHLKNYRDKFLLHCNCDVADPPKSLPKFYRECFEAWATLTKKQPSSEPEDDKIWSAEWGGKMYFSHG